MAGVFTRPLLATEHSEFDTGAHALAFAIARRCGLPLAAVLPLVSNPEFETVAPQLVALAEAEASRKRQSLLVSAQAAGVSLELRVRRGAEPYLEIVDEARARGSDLIVIRRRGKRGLLANLLVGEMVGKVVAHAPCSVLIAPRGATMWCHAVLVGIDPLAPDSRSLLNLASALAAECGLPLRVLCAAASPAARPAAAKALAAALVQARQRVNDADGEVRIGRPHQALLDSAQACGADLLVVGRHGGDRLARAWLGGTAQKVIGLAACPVLVHVNNPQPMSGTP